MKKLYISCPAKGHSVEWVSDYITEALKFAEKMFRQKLSPIQSISSVELDCDDIDIFAKHVKYMTEADYFVGPVPRDKWRMCVLEEKIAQEYEIPIVHFVYRRGEDDE